MAFNNPDDYALVIGIDHYPTFRCLRGPVADADDFYKWLIDPDGGGLDPSHCATVYPPKLPGDTRCVTEDIKNCVWKQNTPCGWYPGQPPYDPDQGEIDQKCWSLLDRVRERRRVTGKRSRRLYFYYSGHGFSREHTGADLCLARWSTTFRSAALDFDNYSKVLVDYGLFDEIVFFLDCCRVSEVTAVGLRASFPPPMADPDAGSVQTLVAFATEYQAVAREAAIGDSGPIRSIFTQVLLNALRGAAARPGGGVVGRDLAAHLDHEVPLLSQKSGKTQIPKVIYGFSTLYGDPVFGRAKPESTVEILFNARRTGLYCLYGPDGTVVHSGNAPTVVPWASPSTRPSYTPWPTLKAGWNGLTSRRGRV